MVIAHCGSSQKGSFVQLLNRSRTLLLKKQPNFFQSLTPKDFETSVYESMCISAAGTVFDSKIESHNEPWFPDISAHRYFGLEVKSTKKTSWQSTGSSILESRRVEGVEEIYILFGQLTSKPDLKIKKYEDCLSDIGITHSPRYKIDMDLDSEETIFSKMGTTYEDLRKSGDPIGLFKDYYRKKCKPGESPWWLDDPDQALSPTTKFYSDLDILEKQQIRIQAFAYFPEILGRSPTKYKALASWMVVQKGLISTSLRDDFTAGGKANLDIGDRRFYEIPKIFENLMQNLGDILELLRGDDLVDGSNHWINFSPPSSNYVKLWASKALKYTTDHKNSDLMNFMATLLKTSLHEEEMPFFE